MAPEGGLKMFESDIWKLVDVDSIRDDWQEPQRYNDEGLARLWADVSSAYKCYSETKSIGVLLDAAMSARTMAIQDLYFRTLETKHAGSACVALGDTAFQLAQGAGPEDNAVRDYMRLFCGVAKLNSLHPVRYGGKGGDLEHYYGNRTFSMLMFRTFTEFSE